MATVDAALMSQLVGHPVRVQWMRHDEHGWDPKGPATVHQLRGGLDAKGEIVGWDHEAWIPAFFETTVIGSVLAGTHSADAVPPPVGGPDPLRHPRQPPVRALPGRHRLGREQRRRPDLRLDPLARAAAADIRERVVLRRARRRRRRRPGRAPAAGHERPAHDRRAEGGGAGSEVADPPVSRPERAARPPASRAAAASRPRCAAAPTTPRSPRSRSTARPAASGSTTSSSPRTTA